MRRTILLFCAGIINLFMLGACSKLSDNPTDPQFVQIQFQYGFKNELNTFDGTYQKDLVLDGTIKVPFWLTTSEQNRIVEKVLAVNFFAFPDTFHKEQGVNIIPDSSPDFLRLKYENQEKSVVCFFPLDTSNPYAQSLRELTDLIRTIIETKPEYKKLPPARGGYL
jgi:hypothetical protein